MIIQIEIPDEVTVGDLTTVAGSILKASTEYVDWGLLYQVAYDRETYGEQTAGSTNPDLAISKPGVVLLDIARQLESATR